MSQNFVVVLKTRPEVLCGSAKYFAQSPYFFWFFPKNFNFRSKIPLDTQNAVLRNRPKLSFNFKSLFYKNFTSSGKKLHELKTSTAKMEWSFEHCQTNFSKKCGSLLIECRKKIWNLLVFWKLTFPPKNPLDPKNEVLKILGKKFCQQSDTLTL